MLIDPPDPTKGLGALSPRGLGPLLERSLRDEDGEQMSSCHGCNGAERVCPLMLPTYSVYLPDLPGASRRYR